MTFEADDYVWFTFGDEEKKMGRILFIGDYNEKYMAVISESYTNALFPVSLDKMIKLTEEELCLEKFKE